MDIGGANCWSGLPDAPARATNAVIAAPGSQPSLPLRRLSELRLLRRRDRFFPNTVVPSW